VLGFHVMTLCHSRQRRKTDLCRHQERSPQKARASWLHESCHDAQGIPPAIAQMGCIARATARRVAVSRLSCGRTAATRHLVMLWGATLALAWPQPAGGPGGGTALAVQGHWRLPRKPQVDMPGPPDTPRPRLPRQQADRTAQRR
jgi:hypothetical protein